MRRRIVAGQPSLSSWPMPTALVVADGSWVINEVRSALSVGWRVEVMDDPGRVTDRLEESRVDAVIIDLQVGSAGGMAIVRSIRQATDMTNRPRMVLLLDRPADEFLARRAGADASVLKPFDPPELRAALAPQFVTSGEEEE